MRKEIETLTWGKYSIVLLIKETSVKTTTR